MNEHLILLVDDDDGIRDALGSLLHDEGYQVVSVSNGREALDYLRADERPCLILLDWMMPVLDGPGFLAEQQLDPMLADIPVVVITAARNASAVGLEGIALVPKPIRLDTLIGAVEKYC